MPVGKSTDWYSCVSGIITAWYGMNIPNRNRVKTTSEPGKRHFAKTKPLSEPSRTEITVAGLGPNNPFKQFGGDTGAKARFDPARVNPNNMAWSLVALTTVAPPTRGRWVNAWGQDVKLAEFAQRAFRVAEIATQQVRSAWLQNQPLAAKSTIHDFTCGGTHLIYSLVVAVRNGYLEQNAEQRLRDQLAMMIYRMWADIDLIDRFFADTPNGSQPLPRWASLDAKWKFLGHAFEVYHYASRHQLVRPTAAEARIVDRARQLLPRLAKEVRELDLDAVRRHNEDLFRQFVGDTCHAYRGVHLI